MVTYVNHSLLEFAICFFLFFEKFKISEGHPLGKVSIFHSNWKCQLRFRDYLEKGDKHTGP